MLTLFHFVSLSDWEKAGGEGAKRGGPVSLAAEFSFACLCEILCVKIFAFVISATEGDKCPP